MDIQASSGAVSAILNNPLLVQTVMVGIPLVFSAAVLFAANERKKLIATHREALDMVFAQGKEICALREKIEDLDSCVKAGRDRDIDMRDQINQLHQDLESVRNELSLAQLYTNGFTAEDEYEIYSPDESEGFAELLKSLAPSPEVAMPRFSSRPDDTGLFEAPVRPQQEQRSASQEPSYPPQQQAWYPERQPERHSQLAAAESHLAPPPRPAPPTRQSLRRSAEPRRASPDMTQNMPMPSDSAFDLHEYL